MSVAVALRNWMMPGTDVVTVYRPSPSDGLASGISYILRLTAGSQSEDRGGAIPGGHMAKNAVLREAPRESLRTRP